MSGFAASAPKVLIKRAGSVRLSAFSLPRGHMGYVRLKDKRLQRAATIMGADALFFGLTDPARAPSVLFIVAFLLMVVSLYYLVRGFMALMAWYGVRATRSKRVALTVAAVVGGLMALQSINQLTTRDMVVVVPLVMVAYFYFSYNGRQFRESP